METVVLNQIFTFDPKGKFVSVKNVEGDAGSIDHDRDSRQSSHTGAGELAGQMREAKAGSFWAKYRLWAAYRLGLNSPSFKNFRSEAGVALEPVQYTFTTRAQAVWAEPGNQREPAWSILPKTSSSLRRALTRMPPTWRNGHGSQQAVDQAQAHTGHLFAVS